MATRILRRSAFGLPRLRRSRRGTLAWAALALVLTGVALVLRAVRWADRNL